MAYSDLTVICISEIDNQKLWNLNIRIDNNHNYYTQVYKNRMPQFR